MLILRPAHTNVSTEERGYKRSPVCLNGPSSLKMIFALLIKVIAVYVQFTIVHLWYFSFKRLLALRWRLSRSLVQLQVGSHVKNSSEESGAGAGTGAGTRVGIRAGTSSGPGVGLRDGAGEVLPE